MVERKLFEVTTKVALFSDDRKSVVVMKYENGFGLPGGHIEASETPGEAMSREIEEELGMCIENLKREDFFQYSDNNKIALAYSGIIDNKVMLTSPHPELEKGIWVAKNEFEKLDIAPSYRKFVLSHWPDV